MVGGLVGGSVTGGSVTGGSVTVVEGRVVVVESVVLEVGGTEYSLWMKRWKGVRRREVRFSP